VRFCFTAFLILSKTGLLQNFIPDFLDKYYDKSLRQLFLGLITAFSLLHFSIFKNFRLAYSQIKQIIIDPNKILPYKVVFVIFQNSFI